MNRIVNQIKTFVKEDFNWKVYSFAVFLMIAALYINYFSGLKGDYFSVEEKYTEKLLSKNLLYFWYIPFYSIPYFLVLCFKLYFENSLAILKVSTFWIKVTAIFIILCFDGGFYFDGDSLNELNNGEQYLITNFIFAGHSFLTSSLLIAIFYFCYDYKKDPFIYGLTIISLDFKPYLFLLILMVPLVFWASTTDDFLNQYPSFTGTFIQIGFGLSKNAIISIYEFVYLLDFINLELMMRGFFVIGMARVLGRHAVLPATIVYMMLHFEKPIGEALGSIFGGYILSVVALRTRSIFGGFIVHMGIAGLLELFAFYQIYSNLK